MNIFITGDRELLENSAIVNLMFLLENSIVLLCPSSVLMAVDCFAVFSSLAACLLLSSSADTILRFPALTSAGYTAAVDATCVCVANNVNSLFSFLTVYNTCMHARTFARTQAHKKKKKRRNSCIIII